LLGKRVLIYPSSSRGRERRRGGPSERGEEFSLPPLPPKKGEKGKRKGERGESPLPSSLKQEEAKIPGGRGK